jgi:proton-translocating NADH-quinone oxidoreductase chain L
MALLLISNNLLQIFLSWEGVSLCSFLLINFWSSRIQANKASIKAFIINRVTDFLLIISFFLIIQNSNSLNLNSIFSVMPFYKEREIFFLFTSFNLVDIISIFLFLGSIGKSAQLFFHTWLPDAMEGPTPVSALIHSATMVTAGIFLIIRFSPIIEYSEFTLKFIILTGAVTALYSGIVALFQYDIKKIIAFSTCSQLGYMFVGCGLSSYNLSLFHMFNHSFFKAMLFLSSGVIIHYMGEDQDIRRFGSLFKIMPLVYIFFLIGGLALIGFPFLTGFYSKEALLDLLSVKGGQLYRFIFWLLIVSIFFTSSYVTRLFYLVFFNKTNSYKSIIKDVDKKFNTMVFSIILLSICSIFFGFYFKEVFTGIGLNFFDNSFFVLPQHNQKIDYVFSLKFLKLFPLFFNFLGILVMSLYYSIKVFPEISVYFGLFNFFNKKFFFDKLYNSYFVELLFYISYNKLYKIYDKKVFNFFGYTKIIKIFDLFGIFLLKVEKNKFVYNVSIIYVFVLIILFCSNVN